MARSDIYKSIIIVIGIVCVIGSIILSVCIGGMIEEFSEELANFVATIVFLTYCSMIFIFCMFFYLLADMLDHLEIISAQTTRTTRVLESKENE